jgi:glycosyl transferase family 25
VAFEIRSAVKNIKNQENRAQIQINLFEAVNGSILDIKKLQDDGIIINPWNTYRYNNAKTEEGKKKVINGEIGCYMSHMNLLKKIASSEYDGWTIIFEDDLVLDDIFKNELKNILENTNNEDENIDMIYL